MAVDLRQHNVETFQDINRLIESGIKKIAVPRATGSGKSYLMGALAEKYNDEPKLVLEPSNPLLGAIKDKFAEFGIENTDFMTYQKLIRMSDEDIAAMRYKVIFLDECHHSTAPKWGQKINYLMATHSDSVVFGTSATVVRSDGVNVVETLFEGNAVDELPLSTAIARGVLPYPTYVTAIYRIDDELEKLRNKVESATNTSDEKKEFYEKIQTMKSHFEKSYGVPIILNKYIKEKSGKYLVFCANKEHIDTMRSVVLDWFRTAGIKDIHSYAVYSDYPDKEKDYKGFCEDNSDSAKILFSINMLNEGIHIKDISGVLMIRPTMSDIVYRQQLGRVLETGNLGKHPLVFDLVNNFSSAGDGVGLLKEIKEAVAKEKAENPDFDEDKFTDIDTFFVLDQVRDVQELFSEIEGRLQGSWDLYIKALKQYKEREGDCYVEKNHVEIVDGVSVKLGRWCLNLRSAKRGKQRYSLTKDRIEQLENLGFIWEAYKYRFKNNVKAVAKYYKENGKYPPASHEDFEIRRLGQFISDEKAKMRNKKENYPRWKENIVRCYLRDFSCEYESNKSFSRFVYYVKLYKGRYGHVDIKINDVIDGYKIGIILYNLKNKLINEEKIEQLKELGIDFEDKDKNKEMFNMKMEMAQSAISAGVIIDYNNQFFNEVNIYNWINSTIKRKYKNGKLSSNEVAVIEQLIDKPLIKFFNHSDIFIKIVGVINKEEITICKSRAEATRIMQKKYGMKPDYASICNRLNGKVTTLYKGRFMFYYATDEEIRKYFEENKVS